MKHLKLCPKAIIYLPSIFQDCFLIRMLTQQIFTDYQNKNLILVPFSKDNAKSACIETYKIENSLTCNRLFKRNGFI